MTPRPVRAVVFDIGGVLERVASPEAWLGRWKERVGMSDDEFDSAARRVDPDERMMIGAMTEKEYRHRSAAVFGLTGAQADEYMCDMWDWYCGELDEKLMSFAAGLRPKYLTAILSNSGSGARKEEEARYAFSKVFDPIIYSHEVGLRKPDPEIYALTCDLLHVQPCEVVLVDDWQVSVDGANDFGMTGLLHQSTPVSIRLLNSLIG